MLDRANNLLKNQDISPHWWIQVLLNTYLSHLRLKVQAHSIITRLARLPNPYKLSILGEIWRAIILPFSFFKYTSILAWDSHVYRILQFFKQTENNHTTGSLGPSPLYALPYFPAIRIPRPVLKKLLEFAGKEKPLYPRWSVLRPD